MTQHLHAVADHGRRQHRTATDLPDLIRPILLRHYLSMLPVPERLNGMEQCGRSNSGNDSHTTRCTCDARHSSTPCLGDISDIDPRGTIGGHPACIATTGATRDERQKEQCCESSGGSVGARQSLNERQPVNPVEESAERLRQSTDCDPARTWFPYEIPCLERCRGS